VEVGKASETNAIDDVSVNGTVNGTVNGIVNGTVSGTVSESDILSVLSDSPNVTYDDLVKLLNMPRRTVARHIKALRERGAIIRIGSDKTGHWEVIISQ
jgi:predicted HTH transcriptional regulator